VHVDADTPAAERKAALAALSEGSIRVIFNVALFGEGVDIPSIDGVVLLRPTASLAVHLQQIGRGLRPADGKDTAVVLDFAANCSQHGLPDEHRTWSLDSKPRRQRDKDDGPRVRKCKVCGVLNKPRAHDCASCGADLRTPRERALIEMQLEQARLREEEDAVALMSRRERWEWAGADERRLRIVAGLSGYSPGWVWHRLQELRQGERARP
jgi:superfamily II DNA or RNA helicase